MKDKNQFPVWCIENKKEVFIGNVFEEYGKYISVYDGRKLELADGTESELMTSLIYLPLMIEDEVLGIISVQSFVANAYGQQHLTILKTLGSYIAIAIANSKSYEVIQSKNRDITDSIRYAQTIQQAILPNEIELNTHLGENFVFFRPRDIVSGDFYWFSQVESGGKEYTFMAVIDCTGHGVPGAFMSMIGYSSMNEVVNEMGILEPSEILERLDASVRRSLHQNERANEDGMDMCLVRIERKDRKTHLVSAGAKRPIYVFRNGEMDELKYTRRAIGGMRLRAEPFGQEETIVEGEAVLYLMTDGFIDQNNASGKRYGTRAMLAYLSSIATLPCLEQKRLLAEELGRFMGNSKQRDDIAVVGIRLT